MIRRSLCGINTTRSICCCGASAAVLSALRFTHVSGWQTSSSTKDVRTREQRDQDRRMRQLEKLPRPEVLHDFQYPFEKRVLCDSWFQPPVYASELDTPQLFNHYPPSDFFVYWNCSDFERSQFPAVPPVDVRTLRPDESATAAAVVDGEKTSEAKSSLSLAAVADQYLRKHELVPQIFPHVTHSVNMSVVFGNAEGAESGDEHQGAAVTSLNRRNFWKSALLGNWMELKDSHVVGAEGPAVFLQPSAAAAATAASDYYTMMILTPDFPCRAESSEWFFLHQVVANLQCRPGDRAAAIASPATGDIVVPYIPPLPTEDGGCSRIVCVLFKQKSKFSSAATSNSNNKMSFEDRINYRLHRDSERPFTARSASSMMTSSGGGNGLAALEALLDPTAQSVCFFQTSWDIQVQEWYEKHNLPEPKYFPQDLVELTEYNALPLDHSVVSSRHAASGAVQDNTVLEQPVKLYDQQNSSTWRLSRATLLSKDRKYIQRPLQRT